MDVRLIGWLAKKLAPLKFISKAHLKTNALPN